MSPADKLAHPWPTSGWIDLRWRKAVWCSPRPFYGANNALYTLHYLTRLWMFSFWLPFLTVKTKWIHFYIGWKPISPYRDLAFYWSKLEMVREKMRTKALFVQLSVRWGIGKIS